MTKKNQASDAANIDIWMPLYIDKIISAVTRLDRADTGSYLMALVYHWKYGPLPADLEECCRIMRIDMGDASSMSQASPKHPFSIALALLRKFFVQTEEGYWVQPSNQRIKEEWAGKRRVFNERAIKAANARWKEKRTKKDASSIPQAMPEDMLEECPVSVSLPVSTSTTPPVVPPVPVGTPPPIETQVEAKKEESSTGPRRDRKGGGVGDGSKLEAARARTLGYEAKKPHPMLTNDRQKKDDPRRQPFKDEICRFYAEVNGGKNPAKTPWGRMGDRALDAMLNASSMNMGDLQTCLKHYAVSIGAREYSPALMPAAWLRELPNYLAMPLNRYGDPLPSKR